MVFAQIMLDEDKLQKFFKELGESFRRSPFEIALWIALIAALIIVPVILTIFATRREKKRKIRLAQKRLHEILSRHGLADSEMNLMTQMEFFFHRDKRRLIDLARDPASFNAAAKKMIEAGLASDQDIAAIRLKLGLLKKSSQEALRSSIDLAPGSTVYLSLKGQAAVKAIIVRVDVKSFSIKTDQKALAGDAAVVEMRLRAGCFLLHTQVQAIREGILELAHTEHIERIQKRRFFRRTVRLPVVIGRQGQTEPLGSYVLDISGGGARVHNSHHAFHVGEIISLILLLGLHERTVIKSRVIRVSQKDSSVSVAFEQIPDSVRDKIIRLIIK